MKKKTRERGAKFCRMRGSNSEACMVRSDALSTRSTCQLVMQIGSPTRVLFCIFLFYSLFFSDFVTDNNVKLFLSKCKMLVTRSVNSYKMPKLKASTSRSLYHSCRNIPSPPPLSMCRSEAVNSS